MVVRGGSCWKMEEGREARRVRVVGMRNVSATQRERRRCIQENVKSKLMGEAERDEDVQEI